MLIYLLNKISIMKKNNISQEEKIRILKLHEHYKKNNVNEELLFESDVVVTNFDKEWDYKKMGDQYYAKRKNSSQWILTKGETEQAIKNIVFKQKTDKTIKHGDDGKTLPSLLKTGFKINKDEFYPDLGYFVNKCTQHGCAQYTYDMIGSVFGDAWQAYKSFKKFSEINSETLKQMITVFNNINKNGMPSLDEKTANDAMAKNILQSLIPSDQSQFNKLPLGTVVGLFYPKSSNFDLAFFQSAIGRSRDNEGNWVQIRKPYFCKQSDKCDDTLWDPSDLKKGVQFKPNKVLKSGQSFIPTTHVGFIGHIDKNGERYVVHNVHQSVFAYPVSKLNKNTLSIVWAGTSKI